MYNWNVQILVFNLIYVYVFVCLYIYKLSIFLHVIVMVSFYLEIISKLEKSITNRTQKTHICFISISLLLNDEF